MTKLHARYMYLFHWHCNYFHFLITAVARLYTCTCTLLHSMNTYKETENSSSWGTHVMYNLVSSICSYSKMMTSNLSWCHKINMSTSVCFMYSTWILVTQRKVITPTMQMKNPGLWPLCREREGKVLWYNSHKDVQRPFRFFDF